MRVLHLRASNFYGGPERQIHFHALECRDSEFDVTIASFVDGDAGRPAYLDVIAQDGVSTHLFRGSSAYDPRVAKDLRRYLRQERIDVVCSHEYRSTALAWYAVRGSRTRWLAFSRGFTTESRKVVVYHSLEKLLARFADHVVAVSQAQKEKMCKLHVPAARITVVPNAIDGERLGQAETVDLHARFGFPPDAFVAVSGGRFSGEKGQAVLLEAAARALPELPSLRVVMFGDGPDLNGIREAITRRGLADRVLCPGFEKNLLGCLKGAQLLVNPSYSEGMPNIVLEGMALNTPVVATAAGGTGEILTDGVSGRLVMPGDAVQLASAMVEAAREQESTRAMARHAQQFVATELTFRRQFELLRDVYRRLAS